MATKKKKQPARARAAASAKAHTASPQKASPSKASPLDPAKKAALTQALTQLVTAAFPRAEVSQLGGATWYLAKERPYCAIVVRASDVVLKLPGAGHDDPEGLLRGSGKAGLSLHLTDVAQIPTARVQAWLRALAHP